MTVADQDDGAVLRSAFSGEPVADRPRPASLMEVDHFRYRPHRTCPASQRRSQPSAEIEMDLGLPQIRNYVLQQQAGLSERADLTISVLGPDLVWRPAAAQHILVAVRHRLNWIQSGAEVRPSP
jgi:hypothetical protein